MKDKRDVQHEPIIYLTHTVTVVSVVYRSTVPSKVLQNGAHE